MNKDNPEILIVGAGPTGLTAALELARQGIIATVIDKKSGPSKLSRAVGITPKSLAIFAASGVDKKIIEQSVALQHNHIFFNKKLKLSLPLSSNKAYFHTLVGLPQDQTEAILIESFKSYGGHIDFGIELNDLMQANDGAGRVEVKLSKIIEPRHEIEQKYDYVFGADGVNSQVRQACHIAYLGYDLDETWSIADVNISNWPYPNDFCLFKLAEGEIAVVVAIGDQRYRVISNTADSIKTLPLNIEITQTHRTGTFNIAVRQAQSYVSGNVYLAGDAAHCHSPVGGRGMNLGIADAAQWVTCLLENRLDEYSNIRHQEGAKVMRMTERGRRMISSTSWYSIVILKTFLTVTKRFNWLKKRVGQFFIEF